MTASLSQPRAAAVVGAICLCAGLASASAAGDGAMIVAQNPPDATQLAQGEEDKEHKKDRGERGQQKGPQGAAPSPNATVPNGQPGPGPGPAPGAGFQDGEPRGRHRAQQPVEQPQRPPQQPQPQQAPVEAPKIAPPLPPQQQAVPQPLPQVVPQVTPQPQQQVAPQPERERTRRSRDDKGAPPMQQPNVATPPVTPPPPQGQPPQFTSPFAPVPGIAPPGTSYAPIPGAPQVTAPAPQNAAPPAPPPSNAQIPDIGFKRRSTFTPGAPATPRERAALPKAPPPQGAQPSYSPKFIPGFQPSGPSAQRLQDLQKNRTQRTEEGGKRTVIEEPDNRIIVRQNNRVFVRHDETLRLATRARHVHSQRRPDGTTETVIIRPGGVQIYNVVDGGGRLIRRYRRDDRGREINIIDNRRFYQGAAAGLAIAAGIGLAAGVLDLHLGPPRIGIPREKYIVDYDRASDDDLYETLIAPPIERLDRFYSLEEIRYNRELRDRMRRIDLNTINFEFGAWDVSPNQYGVLSRIARAINRAVDRFPGEVFLVEGHTDAVGSDIDNLSLSDRRAQAVAEILTQDFDVPPENLVTQGYGEEYLKIPTLGPERANRRVAVRRITPLMARDDYRSDYRDDYRRGDRGDYR